MSVFDRYAPFIQDFIYSHEWESLRGIQVAAGEAIFDTDDNVLLTASTASGKTEAAFFPILTEFFYDPPRSVGAIYVGPLKALINDQFMRLNDLCEEAEIPVWHWHGDVSSSHKAKLLKHPSGILQITPESLEALLLHKHAAVTKLFCDLRYVVIDEVHSLLRGDRGGQCLCCIERLSRMAGVNPRRIGLSATIGDPEGTGAFLSLGTGRACVVPQVDEPRKTWRLSMEHFFIGGPQAVQPGKYPRTELVDSQASDGAGPITIPANAVPGVFPESDRAAAYRLKERRVSMGDAAAHGLVDRRVDDAGQGGAVKFAVGWDASLGADAVDGVWDWGPVAGGVPPDADSSAASGIDPIVIPAEVFYDGTVNADATVLPVDPLRCAPDAASDVAPELADPGIGYIYEHSRNKKCLVFVNSREECEAVTTTLRRYCEANGDPDRFMIHHGNLSASFRETAEDAMRDDERVFTTVTTATLELGIDIGRLERAFQIDAPFTVSSFLQRMGRTGRRGSPPEMWFVMREDEPEPRTLMPESIPWKLVQGIALVQLYLEERWVEPPRLDRLPFSLLYHQTMAELASCGEMSARALAERILTLPYFGRIGLDDYGTLLRHLIETDHIERTEEGGLIVGLAGERITNSYKFYATFQENEEYTVRSESQELGTVVAPPPPGEKLAIAGHVWIVEEVDHKRHLVYCTQVKGKVPAYFGEVAGDIHTRILERMRQVLAERCSYPFLMRNATARLEQARHVAGAADLAHESLVNLGGDTWALFPWLGTYAFLALERLIKIKCADRLGIKGIDSARPYYIQFRMPCDRETFVRVVQEEAARDFDPLELVYPGETPIFDKYDGFIPVELVRKGFAYGVLDVAGMRERVLEWGTPRPALPE